jgi:hypothetical protein
MFAGMDLRLTVLMYPQRGSFKIRFQKFENLNFKFSVEILEDWREKKPPNMCADSSSGIGTHVALDKAALLVATCQILYVLE